MLVGMSIGAATMETVWRFPKILKIELLYGRTIIVLTIPTILLGTYPKKRKTQPKLA